MHAGFGRTYAAEPDVLIEQLRKDEAVTEAATLFLTIVGGGGRSPRNPKRVRHR
jgi:hypothetical protein